MPENWDTADRRRSRRARRLRKGIRHDRIGGPSVPQVRVAVQLPNRVGAPPCGRIIRSRHPSRRPPVNVDDLAERICTAGHGTGPDACRVRAAACTVVAGAPRRLACHQCRSASGGVRGGVRIDPVRPGRRRSRAGARRELCASHARPAPAAATLMTDAGPPVGQSPRPWNAANRASRGHRDHVAMFRRLFRITLPFSLADLLSAYIQGCLVSSATLTPARQG